MLAVAPAGTLSRFILVLDHIKLWTAVVCLDTGRNGGADNKWFTDGEFAFLATIIAADVGPYK